VISVAEAVRGCHLLIIRRLNTVLLSREVRWIFAWDWWGYLSKVLLVLSPASTWYHLFLHLAFTAATHIAFSIIHCIRSQILIVSLSVSQSSCLFQLTSLHYKGGHRFLLLIVLGISKDIGDSILRVTRMHHHLGVIRVWSWITLLVVLKLLFYLLMLFNQKRFMGFALRRKTTCITKRRFLIASLWRQMGWFWRKLSNSILWYIFFILKLVVITRRWLLKINSRVNSLINRIRVSLW